MRAFSALAYLFTLPVLLAAGESSEDLKNMQGLWRVTKSVDAGKEIPQEGEDITVVVFDGNVIKVREGEKSNDLFEFRLFPDKSPKAVELRYLFGKRKGEINHGIYQLDDRKLQICIEEDASKNRPKAFESKVGTTIKLIVLKKI